MSFETKTCKASTVIHIRAEHQKYYIYHVTHKTTLPFPRYYFLPTFECKLLIFPSLLSGKVKRYSKATISLLLPTPMQQLFKKPFFYLD